MLLPDMTALHPQIVNKSISSLATTLKSSGAPELGSFPAHSAWAPSQPRARAAAGALPGRTAPR